jgi:hypothetical protein
MSGQLNCVFKRDIASSRALYSLLKGKKERKSPPTRDKWTIGLGLSY